MYGSSFLSRLNSFLDWSVHVGRLFGIPVRLHVTLLFFLLPVMSGRGMGVWTTLEYVVGVVLSILLHELGHALTAKRYRLTGLSITLHGFGGFAVSSGTRTPTQSLVISLAGPAVTFVLGFLLLGVGTVGLNAVELGTGAWTQLWLVQSLGTLNLLLGVLNLLPSLPFDGGQALVAVLSRRYSEFKAMRAVGHLGLVLSTILFVYGFVTGQNFLALFGFMGLMTSVITLLNSGGIRFGEPFADRRTRKEMEAVKRREAAKQRAYLDDVNARVREREERERLRKLLEASADD